jgi:polyisoprenoid-binding protein YceI
VHIASDLTIKGISHPLEFPATVRFSDKGASAKGQIKIDRTLYDIKYRSGKYFPDIGDRMIYDTFTIDFEIETK